MHDLTTDVIYSICTIRNADSSRPHTSLITTCEYYSQSCALIEGVCNIRVEAMPKKYCDTTCAFE